MADAGQPLPTIRQHFVLAAPGRFVHVRMAGSGPPVVILHESPRSSASQIGFMRAFATRFTLIAMDTPSYGLSDPLPLEQPDIADYADTVVAVLDGLGLKRAALLGIHTGAAIAVETARRHPDRIAGVVTDGYPVFTPQERVESLDNYLVPFRPSLDGAHIAWLWARVRDQFTVYPWYEKSDAARLDFGPPKLAAQQRVAEDFIAAGDGYRTAYAAAFRYDPIAPLEDLAVPAVLCFRRDDILYSHKDRLPAGLANVTAKALGGDRAVATAELVGDLAAIGSDLPATDARTVADRLDGAGATRRMVAAGGFTVDLSVHGRDADPALVLLPDLLTDRRLAETIAAGLSRSFRVIVLTVAAWPEPKGGPEDAVHSLAEAVDAVLDRAGFGKAQTVCFGAAAALAARVSGTAVFVDPWPAAEIEGTYRGTPGPDASGALPDLTPDWSGAHLIAAWYLARDAALYRPWHRRDNTRLCSLDAVDADSVHRVFSAVALAGPVGLAWYAALLAMSADAVRRGGVILVTGEADADAQKAVAREAGMDCHETEPDAVAIGSVLETLVGTRVAA